MPLHQQEAIMLASNDCKARAPSLEAIPVKDGKVMKPRLHHHDHRCLPEQAAWPRPQQELQEALASKDIRRTMYIA